MRTGLGCGLSGLVFGTLTRSRGASSAGHRMATRRAPWVLPSLAQVPFCKCWEWVRIADFRLWLLNRLLSIIFTRIRISDGMSGHRAETRNADRQRPVCAFCLASSAPLSTRSRRLPTTTRPASSLSSMTRREVHRYVLVRCDYPLTADAKAWPAWPPVCAQHTPFCRRFWA